MDSVSTNRDLGLFVCAEKPPRFYAPEFATFVTFEQIGLRWRALAHVASHGRATFRVYKFWARFSFEVVACFGYACTEPLSNCGGLISAAA